MKSGTLWRSKKHKDSSLWLGIWKSDYWFNIYFNRFNGWCLRISLFKTSFQLTYNNKKYNGEIGRNWAKEITKMSNDLLKDINADLFKKPKAKKEE